MIGGAVAAGIPPSAVDRGRWQPIGDVISTIRERVEARRAVLVSSGDLPEGEGCSSGAVHRGPAIGGEVEP